MTENYSPRLWHDIPQEEEEDTFWEDEWEDEWEEEDDLEEVLY